MLHALGLLMVDSRAIARADVVDAGHRPLPRARLGTAVRGRAGRRRPRPPRPQQRAADLARLIATHRVTKAAAVPTVWNDFLPQFTEHELPTLRELLIGGAPVPPELIRRYGAHGIGVAQGWGMTEMSPSGTMARTEGIGAAMPLVELRLVGDAGGALPWDGEAAGELQARGPHVAAAYYNGEPFADGWLRTGDLATIDPDGTVHLVDRVKDLVKSGGEWISSAQLENRARA